MITHAEQLAETHRAPIFVYPQFLHPGDHIHKTHIRTPNRDSKICFGHETLKSALNQYSSLMLLHCWIRD